MKMTTNAGVVANFIPKPCANPRCPNKVNTSVPKRIKFCVQCQLQLRDLRDQFPKAREHELQLLFLGGEFQPKHAAVLIGEPLGTFYCHCEEGRIRVRREGRAIFIDSREILRLKTEQNQWLTLEEAAKETGLPWQRLRTLVYKHKREISSRRDGRGRRVVSFRHLDRIMRVHRRLEATLSKRKGEGKRTKSTSTLISVTKAAEILDYHRDMILLRIRAKDLALRLGAIKIDGRWYIDRDVFVVFCQRIVMGEIKTINHTKMKAEEYLDSLAPN